MYRAIIIDDEHKASLVLKNIVEGLGEKISIIEIVNDPRLAKEAVEKSKPDIVFLDVDMPFLNGFDVLQSFDEPDFEIIFVTGHDEYAINAFRHSATGYILKPIDEDDLRSAVQSSLDRLEHKKSHQQNKILISNLSSNQDKKLGIPTMEGLDFISVSDIVRCEGVQKCTKVIVANKKSIISSYNIGEFVKLLTTFGFFYCHKSHLINLNKIDKYYKDGTITMSDGSTIPLARRRKQEFLAKIDKVS